MSVCAVLCSYARDCFNSGGIRPIVCRQDVRSDYGQAIPLTVIERDSECNQQLLYPRVAVREIVRSVSY